MFYLAVIISYFIGSIPTAYIFGKQLKGIDIREHGSGNVGATNVFRVLGKKPGFIVLFLDILKGVLAVWLLAELFHIQGIRQIICLGIAAVCGHNWTIFLKFKGGKGIATSLGALIGFMIIIPPFRIVVALTVLVWMVAFLITTIVSVSSILASIFLPLAMVYFNQSFELVLCGVLICVFVVCRHKANIQRLLKGQEPRVPLYRSKNTKSS